jgi:phosphate-selective porin OprO/OprP
MKFLITPLALALMAGPLAAQTSDAEKRIAELEKKVAKLSKLEAKADEAKDSGFSVKFGGRIHLDSVYFNGGQNKLPDGTFMRRARISFKANAGENWVGEGDVDFAESAVNIKDMWIGYTGFKNALVQIGQFKEPFGMDTLTSSNNTWMTERSFSDIWTPDRHIGVAYSTWGNRFHAKASFFGQAIDDTSAAQEAADTAVIDNISKPGTPALATYKIVDNHGYGAAARFVFLPIKASETKFVHLGVAAIMRKPNAAAPGVYAVDFSGRPEQNKVSRAKFVGAAVTNVDNWKQSAVEFAGLWGPFSWQSEFQQTNVYRRNTQMLKNNGISLVATSAAEQLASTVDHKFSTYYAQVSYIFGGQRTYEISDGIFKSVKASSKKGALEVALRVSQMNQDDLTTIDAVKGGIVKNMTLGLTYYLNKSIRFMVDYTKVDPNENSAPSGAYSPTGKKIYNDDFGFTSMRMQINF